MSVKQFLIIARGRERADSCLEVHRTVFVCYDRQVFVARLKDIKVWGEPPSNGLCLVLACPAVRQGYSDERWC